MGSGLSQCEYTSVRTLDMAFRKDMLSVATSLIT